MAASPTRLVDTAATSAAEAAQTADVQASSTTQAVDQPRLVRIEAGKLFVGSLPIMLAIQGANLDKVTEARLRLGTSELPLKLQPEGPNRLLLILESFDQGLVEREAEARLLLNGVEQTSLVTLQNYIETKSLQGIRPEFAYTNRIVNGNQTRLRVAADVDSERGEIVLANEQVDILSTAVAGWYRVRLLVEDAARNGQEGWIERWLVDGEPPPPTPVPPTPVPRATSAPTPTPRPSAKLRFVASNYNDTPTCISVQIRGISTAGWRFTINGLNLGANFDTGGNARVCGLGDGQEVTISVLYSNGSVVLGGGGVPSKGSAIMVADWR